MKAASRGEAISRAVRVRLATPVPAGSWLAGSTAFLEKTFDGQRSWNVIRESCGEPTADPDIL